MANRWLTATMVDDFIHDPVLATEIIFGFRLPPHQQLRIWGMWTSPYMIDSSGAGSGKSFTIAIVSALRSILFQDRVSGIIGRGYGQGKLIYDNFDKWLISCPIFREQIRLDKKHGLMSVHGGEACQLTFKNGNIIRVIPPDFAKDGLRVASESFTDGYFDEWTRFQNYGAFNKVFLGRVRKPIPECYPKDDPVFGNHIFMSGTAQSTSHPAYTKVLQYQDHIANGDRRYELQSWNFTHIPKEYEREDNTAMSREAQMDGMPADQIETEIYGRWVADSVGFYNAADIKMCRTAEAKEVMAL